MSTVFVNRQAELEALDDWWRRSQRAALVWGRRRVGKTALLQRFARDKHTVFHTGAGRSAQGELAQLSRQVAAARLGGARDLLARPYTSWDDALDHLVDRVDARAPDRPLLVVLDEFPELTRTSPELPGILRAVLDRPGVGAGLRLLLCGSAVRSMTALAEERAPLYGRFDLQLQVHPFTPAESALMLPDLAPADRALVYGLVGGMPLYLSWWDQDADLRANLDRLACRPAAPLLTEGQLVLATEAETGELPSAALYAVASGATRHNEVRQALGQEPSRTLDRLIELRLVERLRPVTEPDRTRQRRYRIADNFLAFYLSVLSRYRGEIERGLGPAILPALLASLDDHMGPVWEAAVRDHVRRLAVQGDLPLPDPGQPVVAVGPWWTPDGRVEIDAVALAGRSRRAVLALEAKWSTRVDASRLVPELRRKAERLPGAPDDLVLGVAARQVVENAPPGTLTVTADDVFSPSVRS